jgi:hypothetical protein
MEKSSELTAINDMLIDQYSSVMGAMIIDVDSDVGKIKLIYNFAKFNLRTPPKQPLLPQTMVFKF